MFINFTCANLILILAVIHLLFNVILIVIV